MGCVLCSRFFGELLCDMVDVMERGAGLCLAQLVRQALSALSPCVAPLSPSPVMSGRLCPMNHERNRNERVKQDYLREEYGERAKS